jgi:photosystem II stability/assembly factor-like uncharacterized protein
VGRLPAQSPVGATVSDPQHPERVYAASGSGVFRSDDGGQTWETASQGMTSTDTLAIALDGGQPQHLYAATASGTLYESDDGATSWRASAGPSTGGQ